MGIGVCPCLAYVGDRDTQTQGLAPWGGGIPHVFMQGLTYAGVGDTQMQGLAPWGWGIVIWHLTFKEGNIYVALSW